ncbi:hypothetical protein [Dyella sp.]|uniref:hypothetical protein n=1 Tax=Dyella sp. TaxID=1869338 RepID=UPI002ED0B2D7
MKATSKPANKPATRKAPASKVAVKVPVEKKTSVAVVAKKEPAVKKATPTKPAAASKPASKPTVARPTRPKVRPQPVSDEPKPHISPEEAVAHIQALLDAKQERIKQGPNWPGAEQQAHPTEQSHPPQHGGEHANHDSGLGQPVQLQGDLNRRSKI